MHPAYSVIFLTISSGAGYGLLFWLCIAQLTGGLVAGSWAQIAGLALALALITAGLLASTFHLGRPERAFRAITQWRSSWLSREGLAAIVTYVPAGLLGLFWLVGAPPAWTSWAAAFGALGAALTVYCSGMIYASLRTIPQWHLGLVPAIYLALAAASGALLLDAVFAAFGQSPAWAALVPALSLAAGFALKRRYFAAIDGARARYTRAMALGFGPEAQIAPLDPPHAMPNFVMREMGYEVGRRHAARLRMLMMVFLFALPLALVLLALIFGGAAPYAMALAVLSAAFGVLLERWLFFAEAQHVSMLYYTRSGV
jgi:DMSO reductase anchor subunit